MKKRLKVKEGKLVRMKEDMNAKVVTVISIKNRFSYKVRVILIDSFFEKYLVIINGFGKKGELFGFI